MEPTWTPTEETIRNANLTWLMGEVGVDDICDLHRWSVEHREEFWSLVVDRLGVVWSQQPTIISEGDPQHTRWFPDGRLNIVETAIGSYLPDDIAVIHRANEQVHTVTRGELADMVSRFGNGVRRYWGQPRVAIVMPMTLEAVVAYLATVVIGGAVVSIADSFASDEIARRLRISETDVVVTQDEMIRSGTVLPMYQKVKEATDLPIVVVESTGGIDEGNYLSWSDLADNEPDVEPFPVSTDHLSNILFSSGTTGDPKAIPWTHLTPIKGAMDAHFLQDVHPGDVVAWPTNLGWMMGPWLIYASLLNGAAMALHDDVPTDETFCRFVAEAGVTMLGVVPSMVRAWRTSNAVEEVDWSAIKVFSSTGEASTPADMDWLMRVPGRLDGSPRPVIEYCGGTEIGGGYFVGTVLQPAIPSTFSMPALGLDIRILSDGGEPSDSGTAYLVPPSIGLSDRLLNREHDEVYYADLPEADVPLRHHGDQMERLPNGYHRARGRSDDTMNLGGIKVSSAELEDAVSEVDGVLETAAVAVAPPDGGPDRLVVFAVPQPGVELDADVIRREMQDEIRSRLNPLFKISELVVVDALPRTASNKVMRRVLRAQVAEAK